MKRISLSLPNEVYRQLTARARQEGRTKAALIREALEEYLGPPKIHATKGSALELAGDLVGSLEGPEDLSCNKAYLEDFGR